MFGFKNSHKFINADFYKDDSAYLFAASAILPTIIIQILKKLKSIQDQLKHILGKRVCNSFLLILLSSLLFACGHSSSTPEKGSFELVQSQYSLMFATTSMETVKSFTVNLQDVSSGTLSVSDTSSLVDEEKLSITEPSRELSDTTAQVFEVIQQTGTSEGTHTIMVTLETEGGTTEVSFEYTVFAGTGHSVGAVQISSNGQYMFAGVSEGGLFISSDYGQTWLESTIGASGDINSIASSSNGQYLLAASSDFKFYLSTDYGVTWGSEAFLPTTGQFRFTNVSDDGQNMLAVSWNKKSYISNDFGTNWSVDDFPGGDTYATAMSDDGLYMLVGGNSTINLSADAGVSWFDEVLDAGSRIHSLATSSDGQYMVAGNEAGDFFYSSDYGTSWNMSSSDEKATKAVYGIATSDDGQYMVAGSHDKNIYVSNNFGQSWISPETAQTNGIVYGVASSTNGQYMVAGSGKMIYVSNDYGETWTNPVMDEPESSFYRFAISDDGQYIIAANWDSKVYVSDDFGQNFSSW